VIGEAVRRHADLPVPIAAFARLDPALDFNAADGYPTELVVLLASPTGGSAHLQALSCLARGLRDRAVRDRMRAAECRDSMYVALLGDNWSHGLGLTFRQQHIA
jgi:mannitol/fructose-specific phosphotransferase system IIA component (Ntr-type)